jgi:quinolinate synthase
VLFLPDEHLGRNTGFFKLGIPRDEMILWDPKQENGGNTPEAVRRARILLWKGHCSVHGNFQPEHVDLARQRDPAVRVIVHPECTFEVVEKADLVGSTDFILRKIWWRAWRRSTRNNRSIPCRRSPVSARRCSESTRSI